MFSSLVLGYGFNWMPFGIMPVSIILQKRNYKIYGDIENGFFIADDMIIEADGDHNDTLRKGLTGHLRKNKVQQNKVAVEGLICSNGEVYP